jgi:hypothetical protein
MSKEMMASTALPKLIPLEMRSVASKMSLVPSMKLKRVKVRFSVDILANISVGFRSVLTTIAFLMCSMFSLEQKIKILLFSLC